MAARPGTHTRAVAAAALVAPLGRAQAQECAQFARGETAWVATAGASRDPDLGTVAVGNVEVERYVRDCVGVFVGLNLGYDGPRQEPNGWQAGPAAGLRWYFWTGSRWSAYVDGLVAAVRHQHALTARSLRFNFDLQGGAGLSRTLGPDTRLLDRPPCCR